MGLFVSLLVNALAVFVSAYLLPGVYVDGLLPALFVAALLSVFNAFLRPILIFLTLPITILTLGLFIFIINAFLIMLVSRLVVGFSVSSFLSALAFSLVLSIANSLLNALV